MTLQLWSGTCGETHARETSRARDDSGARSRRARAQVLFFPRAHSHVAVSDANVLFTWKA